MRAEPLVIGVREHIGRGNSLCGDAVPVLRTIAPCEVLVCTADAPDRGA